MVTRALATNRRLTRRRIFDLVVPSASLGGDATSTSTSSSSSSSSSFSSSSSLSEEEFERMRAYNLEMEEYESFKVGQR